jgi:hypothetical protein
MEHSTEKLSINYPTTKTNNNKIHTENKIKDEGNREYFGPSTQLPKCKI